MLKNNQLNHATNNCRLEADCKIEKRVPIAAIFGGVTLALALLFGIFYLTASSPFLGILSLVFILAAIGFFATEIFTRAKTDKEIQAEMDQANQTYFEDAEVIPVFSTERMFYHHQNKNGSQNTEALIPDESAVSVDTEMSFGDVVTSFLAFAEERGCKMDAACAKKLFASFASSRILLLRSMPKEEFSRLLTVVSEYFGTHTQPDKIDDGNMSMQSILFTQDGQKKPLMQILEAAQAEKEKLHFVAFDSVSTSVVNCLETFVNYAKAPEASHCISATADQEINTYYLPSNLWFILNLAEGERPASLPQTLLEISTLSDITISVCEGSESLTPAQPISYTQMRVLIEKASCNIDESEWKHLDSFTDFLNKQLSFSISNKQWISMEKYIAVLNTCNENAEDALDEALCAKTVPSIIAKAESTDVKVDIAGSLISAFGDFKMQKSRKAIKELGKSNLLI